MDVTVTNKVVELAPVIGGEDIIEMQRLIREMPMAEPVQEYALKLVVATHPGSECASGSSQ